jgi:hypothetical protein
MLSTAEDRGHDAFLWTVAPPTVTTQETISDEQRPLPVIATDEDLDAFLLDFFNVRLPNVRCAGHSAPWHAFHDAYFARSPVSVWKASRGFGGKSFTLALLGLTEALTLRADVNILGGSAGKPTIRAPKFGQWLERRRGPSRSLEWAAGRVRHRLAGLAFKFHRSQLLKIEQEGALPPVPVIYALADYHVSPTAMVSRIATELGFRDAPGELPDAPLLSDRAFALARWFDQQPASKQDAFFQTFNIPDNFESVSKRGA